MSGSKLLVFLDVSNEPGSSTVVFEKNAYLLALCWGKKMVRRIFDCHGFVISVRNMLGMEGIYPHSWMERPHALLHKWFMGIYSTYAA